MSSTNQFFHVSRHGELPSKLDLDTRHLEIVLRDDASRSDHEILGSLKHYFPNGYSKHGFGYLTEPFKYCSDESGHGLIRHVYAVELVFELIRRLQYPSLPSRYTSFFGFNRIENALAFRTSINHDACPIYKVEGHGHFKADMNLLLSGQNSIHTLSYANRYWNGEESENPTWEFLLTHPVTVVERVY
jgi:hypothetical protein